MKNIISKIYERVGVKSARTENIIKHIGWSFAYKAGGILASLMLVPLAIGYLDNENYGVWLTVSSFMIWFSFFDIGLGNGLRNKFAEAKALDRPELAQAYVSSAYFTIGSISLGLFVIFLAINAFIDWTFVFNTDDALYQDLSHLMPILFGFFGLQLVVKLITSVYAADQHHSIQVKVQFYTHASSLIALWFLTQFSKPSLLSFGVMYSLMPVLVLFMLNWVAFKGKYQRYKPKWALWKKEHLKDITGLGFKFFIIQIAALILFSTDNFIVSQLFSPAEVVPYNISHKYFSLLIMIYGIIVTPYWSSFTEAFAKEDYNWIKNSVRNIQKVWLFVPAGLLVMLSVSSWFYHIWVGDEVLVPFGLSLSMALFVLLMTYNMIYVNFINGVGKIKVQLVTAIISIIINIPLSIFFATVLNLGTPGVMLATCFSLGNSIVFRRIQYHKLVNRTAQGIWNK